MNEQFTTIKQVVSIPQLKEVHKKSQIKKILYPIKTDLECAISLDNSNHDQLGSALKLIGQTIKLHELVDCNHIYQFLKLINPEFITKYIEFRLLLEEIEKEIQLAKTNNSNEITQVTNFQQAIEKYNKLFTWLRDNESFMQDINHIISSANNALLQIELKIKSKNWRNSTTNLPSNWFTTLKYFSEDLPDKKYQKINIQLNNFWKFFSIACYFTQPRTNINISNDNEEYASPKEVFSFMLIYALHIISILAKNTEKLADLNHLKRKVPDHIIDASQITLLKDALARLTTYPNLELISAEGLSDQITNPDIELSNIVSSAISQMIKNLTAKTGDKLRAVQSDPLKIFQSLLIPIYSELDIAILETQANNKALFEVGIQHYIQSYQIGNGTQYMPKSILKKWIDSLNLTNEVRNVILSNK